VVVYDEIGGLWFRWMWWAKRNPLLYMKAFIGHSLPTNTYSRRSNLYLTRHAQSTYTHKVHTKIGIEMMIRLVLRW
jgi:hypothetical protein